MKDDSKHEGWLGQLSSLEKPMKSSRVKGIGHHRGAGPPTAAPVKSDPNSLRISAQTFAIGDSSGSLPKGDFDHIQAYRADPLFGFSLRIGQVLSLPTIRQRLD
jgi:hypothetical protein